MADPYLGLIEEQWPNITSLYNEHAEKYPVMLVDVRGMEIHAFHTKSFDRCSTARRRLHWTTSTAVEPADGAVCARCRAQDL